MPKFIDMTGKTLGNIVVLRVGELVRGGDRRWLCRCGACAKEFLARGKDLRRGDYISCGCVGKERTRERCRRFTLSHGENRTPLHRKWQQMWARCRHDSDYLRRGVQVCNEWRDFLAFKADMAATWKPGLSLERKDPRKGYSADNCCWIPVGEQARNRTNCPKVVYGGKERFLWEVAGLLGIRRQTLWQRYHRGVRPPELFNPIPKKA